MKKKIVVAISGASGVVYGIEFLKLLKESAQAETHLILTESGITTIGIETGHDIEQIRQMADFCYDNHDLTARIASGSFLFDAVVVIPCSIKSLSMIVNSINENLLTRAADVSLKEKRKLVLVVRETPLHTGHLRLMLSASELGAHILPPIPAFYHHPQSISDLIHHNIGKIFDYLAIDHQLYKRWDPGG
ncbi:MAG: UbiX family flavin prenyltransferase [Deltaproteobacteria bacterium]|nr:UbiX family flavin prenyltransferase [Deltaproteobacteria bacterium]